MEFIKQLGAYSDRVLLKNDEGDVVSSLTMVKEDKHCFYDQLNRLLLSPNGSAMYLEGFGTRRKSRKQGYGRMLLEYTIAEYGENIIYLGVSSCDSTFSNKKLIEFYESVGFKKINYNLSYQFMVYDKYGKIADKDLSEKVIKINPQLKPISNTNKGHREYILPGIDVVKVKPNHSGSMLIGHCALLRHKRHKGYCQLFKVETIKDKYTDIEKFELVPLCDENDNVILIKYRGDCMHVYITRTYRNGKWYCEFETDRKYGLT